MNKIKIRGIAACLTLLLALSLAVGALGAAEQMIPDTISHFSDEAPSAPAWCSLTTEDCGEQVATVRLLGILPIKEVRLQSVERMRLCPGGTVFGLRAPLGGVLVTSLSGVPGEAEGRCGPAEECGIRRGDLITAIDGIPVSDATTLCRVIGEGGGKPICLTVLRHDRELTFTLAPRASGGDKKFYAGLLVKDSVAGIGTITYIDPATGSFGGLGHGVYDEAAGGLVRIGRGAVTAVELSGVAPGAAGKPGELRGHLEDEKIGTLLSNTDCGVFGILADPPPSDTALPLGLRGEVKTGDAEILCTVDGSCERYSIEITNLRGQKGTDKSFSIRVTDQRLLEKTGGIVQGMSGSPIIQNGKLIGAVTHVMINDPTCGYGIFIENMLAAAGGAIQKAA